VTAREAMRSEMIDMNQSRNRVGKKRAGRLLDGRTWDQFPGQMP
jgi:protein gp37